MQWLRDTMRLSTQQRRTVAALVAGTLAVLVSLVLQGLLPHPWLRWEGFFSDLRNTLWVHYRGPGPNDPSSPVTVIDIDDRTMEQLGVYGASYRKHHAQLLDTLAKYHAGVVVFDILFKNRTSSAAEILALEQAMTQQGAPPLTAQQREALKTGLDVSQQFEQSVKKFPRTVLAAQLGDRLDYPNTSDWVPKAQKQWQKAIGGSFSIHAPIDSKLPQRSTLDQIYPELAQSSKNIGLANMVPDQDGKLRRLQYLWRFPDTTIQPSPQFPFGGAEPAIYATLSVQAARVLLGRTQETDLRRSSQGIQLGESVRIWKNPVGKIETSCPGLTEWMLYDLIEAQAMTPLSQRENQLFTPTQMITIRVKDSLLPIVVLNSLDTIPPIVIEKILHDSTLSNTRTAFTPKFFDAIASKNVTYKRDSENITFYYPTLDQAVMDSVTYRQDFLTRIAHEIHTALHSPQTNNSILVSSWIEIWWDTVQKKWLSSLLPLNGQALEQIVQLDKVTLQKLAIGDTLSFGPNITIPTKADFSNRIFFPAVAHSNANNNTQNWIRHVSYLDVLQGKFDPTLIAGRAFVIGSSATALADFVDIPLEPRHPGVDIQALALHNALTDNQIRELPPSLTRLFPWLAGLLIAGLAIFLSPLKTVAWGFAAIAVWFVAGFWCFEQRIWLEFLPVATPLATGALLVLAIRFGMEEKDRRFLHKSFGSYVAPELIDIMIEKRVYPKLGGDETQITALFTDIQSFSSFSEALGSPTKLVQLLNEYLSAMTNILLKHQGTLDKYIGDAIVAMFGAPLPVANHAQLAVETAVAMQDTLLELQKHWQSQENDWPDLVKHMRMRIGLNTGNIVTGNMGSPLRMNYTMMGDDVNLAARLESAAKQYGVWILASEATISACDDSFLIRKIDCVRVVGKTDSVNIYEVLGRAKTAPQSWHTCVLHFNRGMHEYLEGHFEQAIREFEVSEREEPWIHLPFVKKNPSTVLLKRCQYLLDHPPENWDGIHTATEK